MSAEREGMTMTETTTDLETADRIRPEIAARIDKLPSLSNVVGDFLKLSMEEFVTAKDFEKVICRDQALVARLLKTANSGKYGKSRSINSISEAMVLIGLDNMKRIVYAVSSEGLLHQAFKVYHYPGHGFWMHSLGVATTCRTLVEAAPTRVMDPEASFVTGLIHDVGKLIIDDFLPDTIGRGKVELADEEAAAGMDHADLGAHIMASWNIPEAISGAACWHHDPDGAGDHRPGALALAMSDSICNLWGVGTDEFMNLGEDVDPTQYGEALEALGISAAGLESILFDVRQRLVGLEELLGN